MGGAVRVANGIQGPGRIRSALEAVAATGLWVIDGLLGQCHIGRVKTKKAAMSDAESKTSGMKLVEKYRQRMSRLTDAERQKLTARGLQIIYGDAPAAKAAHRG